MYVHYTEMNERTNITPKYQMEELNYLLLTYKLFFALLTLNRRATQCFRYGKNTLKNSEFLEKSAFNEAIIVELS